MLLLVVTAVLACPAAASALTISGTAVRDEQAGGAWALCDGATPNVSMSVDGGPRSSTPCDRSTGAFSFTTTLSAANQTIAVFLDPGLASPKAVAYTHNVDTTSNITGIQLIHDRVIVRSESSAAVTGAQMALFDASHDTDIPVDVAGGRTTLDAGVSARVDAGDTWQPGGTVSADHIHVRGTLDMRGLELKGSGRGDCGFGAGVSRPLCISADTPAAWAAGAALGFGVTVVSAPNRSSARWGTGTSASDVGTLLYAGPSLSTPVTLASTSSGTGVAETTRIGLRANPPANTRPGTYTTTIVLSVVENP